MAANLHINGKRLLGTLLQRHAQGKMSRASKWAVRWRVARLEEEKKVIEGEHGDQQLTPQSVSQLSS
jgi:hypothetical protein